MILSVVTNASPVSETLLLGFRILGFGLMMCMALPNLLFIAIVMAVACSLLIFSFPFVVSGDLTFDQFLLGEVRPTSLSVQQQLLQVGVGLILGAVAAAGFLLAKVIASVALGWLDEENNLQARHSLELAFLSLAVISFTPITAYAAETFVASFLELPLNINDAPALRSAWQILVSIGQMALSVAIVVLIPVFLMLMSLWLICALLHRFFPSLLDSGLIRGVSIPLMCLGLAFVAYRFSHYGSEIYNDLLSVPSLRSLIEVNTHGR